MVVPSAIFVVLVFGHEFWRRICPLYFFSQLPRALGMKPLLNIEAKPVATEKPLLCSVCSVFSRYYRANFAGEFGEICGRLCFLS